MENSIKMVPVQCTQCGGIVEVNKFGIMFALMIAVCLIMFVILQFTGNTETDTTENTEYGDYSVECSIEDGCLYTQINGTDIAEWKYLESESMGTMLQYEQNDIDSYNSCVSAGHNMNGGAGYVVKAAYERNITEDAHPLYYSVVSVTIEDSSISEARILQESGPIL